MKVGQRELKHSNDKTIYHLDERTIPCKLWIRMLPGAPPFSGTKRATLGLAPGLRTAALMPSSRSFETAPSAQLLGLKTWTSGPAMRTAWDSEAAY